MTLKHKDYIGDGVYVGFDGYQIWLMTGTGAPSLDAEQHIALEPAVWRQLQEYVAKLNLEYQGQGLKF